jgi:hypothetical protein
MMHAPWASFQSLESLSVAFPYIELPIDVNVLSTVGMDVHMELLTFPASLLTGHSVPLKIKTSTETGGGYIS